MEDGSDLSGWKMASVTGGTHLKRLKEMYEEMGFEVRLEEVSARECGQCTLCFEQSGEQLYRVYTRRKQPAPPGQPPTGGPQSAS